MYLLQSFFLTASFVLDPFCFFKAKSGLENFWLLLRQSVDLPFILASLFLSGFSLCSRHDRAFPQLRQLYYNHQEQPAQ
jgi:hypothetical protein